MKRTLGIIAALAFAMTASLAAYAANSESKTFSLFQSVEVNGTTLQPGTYKVSFDASGPATQVTFSQGKKEIVSTSGQVKNLPEKQRKTQIKMSNTESATPRLVEIDFRGGTTGIQFAEPAGTAGQ